MKAPDCNKRLEDAIDRYFNGNIEAFNVAMNALNSSKGDEAQKYKDAFGMAYLENDIEAGVRILYEFSFVTDPAVKSIMFIASMQQIEESRQRKRAIAGCLAFGIVMVGVVVATGYFLGFFG